MSILGNRVVRREDPKFLTTGGVYGEDLPFDGALWVTFVRSTLAHARITSIDTEEAKRIPGVVGIYSGRDVDLPVLQSGLPGVPP
jgi:carbon-monoxide dehydrogenase large subunit